MKLPNWITRLFNSPVRPVRAVPASLMEADDVRDAVADVAGTRGWHAIHQELDAAIADAIDDVSMPVERDSGPTAEGRAFAAGGVDHLRRFQARLLSLQPTGPEGKGE